MKTVSERLWKVIAAASVAILCASAQAALAQASAQTAQPNAQSFDINQLPEVRDNPPAPAPEPVVVSELPLPPTAPSETEGSCTAAVNPHHTGCMSAKDTAIEEGPAYLWGGKAVLLSVVFTGAPAAPDPASIYSGLQVLLIKTDGTKFPNGDAWKCITCGVPAANEAGANHISAGIMGMFGKASKSAAAAPAAPMPISFDHPQAFHGDRKIIAGTNVVDCGAYRLIDAACTPKQIHIYPIQFGFTPDTVKTAAMRELRLNPDGVHLGFSAFVPGRFDEVAIMGRLVFVAGKAGDPSDGPHYELVHMNILLNASPQFRLFTVDPKNPGVLIENAPRAAIGEFRGWSGDGRSALGNFWVESGNVDLFKTSLATGESTRITRDPAYTDPMKASPDGKWDVVMDARQYGRHMYFAAMRGIPPLIDSLTMSMQVCCYNNGNRRFFQPFLLDAYGDRGNYHGQQLNAGPGTPGSASDPDWNGRADPAWSPDETNAVYWQALVTAPSCGGDGQQTCPVSTEPGGRRTRLMIARLTSRKPVNIPLPTPVPDIVPWAVQFKPGDPIPSRGAMMPPPGTYKLFGKVSGSAEVQLGAGSISVRYDHFSDDGGHIIDGTESAKREPGGMMGHVVLHSDLHASGLQHGTKMTSEPGGFIVPGFRMPGAKPAGDQGSLTTTIDGVTYTQPKPGN